MAHEIAHVKRRHVARLARGDRDPDAARERCSGSARRSRPASPRRAGRRAGRQPEPAARSTRREFEDEADAVGTVFMARAGYDPRGMARFFERLLAIKETRPGFQIPPYLHEPSAHRATPRRRDRARAGDHDHRQGGSRARRGVLAGAGAAGAADARAALDAAFVPPRARHRDHERRHSRQPRRWQRRGELAAAANVLADAGRAEPNDPRVAFREAELLAEQGRTSEAIAAYRRALLLDPEVALSYL